MNNFSLEIKFMKFASKAEIVFNGTAFKKENGSVIS
jgi:hypothetical protein